MQVAVEMKLLCPKEVAARIGCTPKTAVKLLRRDEIRGFKLSGKYWRTTDMHIELYVSRKIHERAAELAGPRRIGRPRFAA